MSNKKQSKSWIWLVAVVVAGGSVLAYGRGPGNWFSNEGSAAIPGAVVRRGPLAIRVVERGNLKAADFVSIKNELEGSSTILSLIREGALVKEGDLLCELDATNQIEKRVQQEIAVRNSDAAHVKATQTYAIQVSQNESDIAQAIQKLSFAEQDLQKYVEGDKVLSLSKASQAITLQKEEHARAKNKLDWSLKLADKGFLTQTELEADRLAKVRAEVMLDQAEREEKLLIEYQVKRDTDKLQADLAEAKRELERVKLQAKARLVDFESDRDTNAAKLKIEKEKLAKLDNQIAKAKIYAPKAGMVVYAKQEEGRGMGQAQPIQEGTQVRERQELITIPTAGGMLATVSLHESVLKQVHPGLSCDVIVDALNKTQFHGTIKSVAVLPDQNSWWANPNTRLYTTTVEIHDGNDEMRPGMSCAVDIRIDDIPDAIYVPVQSVFRHLGKNIAFVDRAQGRYDVVEVETNRFNDSHVEITKGLSEGQIVLLSPPASFLIQAGANETEVLADPNAPPGVDGPGATAQAGDPNAAPGTVLGDATGARPDGMPRGKRGNAGENDAGESPGGRPAFSGEGRRGRGQRPGTENAPLKDGDASEKPKEEGDSGTTEKDTAPKSEGSGKPGEHR